MADNIIFLCPHCNQNLEIEPTGAGMAIKCPTCGNDIEVPKSTIRPPDSVTKPTVPDALQPNLVDKSTMPASDTKLTKNITPGVPARRPFLFSVVVALALTFSIIAVVLLIITGVKYIRLAVPSSTNVEYGDIMPSPANAAMEWKEVEKQLAPIVIKNVSGKKSGGRRGGGDRESILISWVSSLDASERNEFCRNLETIVEEAERRSNDVWQVMNEYAKLKQAKLRELRIQETSRRKSTSLNEMGLATAGLFVTAVLLALFAGVTALLAVEKNTRRAQND